MRLSEQINPIAEMTQTREPLIITQNGEATCVIHAIKSDEKDKNTLALLKILARGNKQIEQGKFKPARVVFADLDKEFAQ